MQKLWSEKAWDDYLWWQRQDKKTLRRINELIKSVEREDGKPMGKAELLKGNLAGYQSVRIDRANRLTYTVQDGVLYLLRCRGHYE